nr:hypothetical protein CFP56_00826 [Quercus suber]
MAQRTDAHFEAARSRSAIGNFGHLGILDLICRTSLTGTTDVVDDMKDEAQKHALDNRIEAAVAKALAKVNGCEDPGRRKGHAQHVTAHDGATDDKGKYGQANEPTDQPTSRETRWRKGRKG